MRFWQDIVYGARNFKRTPGFSATAILTLALGIGATTAIFSVVQAVLLRPLPYRDSGRLVAVWDREVRAKGVSKLFDTYQDFENYQRNCRSFDRIAAATWATGPQVVSGRGPARNILAMPVSLGFFPLLGVSPALGRTFVNDDSKLGCAVVVAHRFWQEALGGDAKIVGETLRLNDQACNVVGVMPAGFAFYPEAASMWTLVTKSADAEHIITGIFGHLKPGLTIQSAQSELRMLHAKTGARHSAEMEPTVYPLKEEFTWLASRSLKITLLLLFGAVGFVLLIGCVNVANLLLGRSLVRQKELAIRAALGSGRRGLLQQLLTEALLLSLCGAVLGDLLAVAAVRWFHTANPVELPPGARVSVDIPVLAFTVALSILTTVLFGFLPAWRASRINLNDVLKAQGRGATQTAGRRALAKALVVAEIALSLVLLVGAGLLIRSVAQFASAPLTPGAECLITMTVSLPSKSYSTNDQKIRFFTQLIDSLRSLPDVRQALLTTAIPLWGGQGLNVLEVEGHPATSPGAALHDTGVASISPEYLAVVGPSLERGRPFDSRDGEQSQLVAIVNDALMKKYFTNEDPLGRHIRLFEEGVANPWLTIVGIAANQKHRTVYQEMAWAETPMFYRPFRQEPAASVNLMISSRQPAARVGAAVQSQAARIDPSVPVGDVQTMQHLLDRQFLAYPRFRTALFGGFAALALLLAVVGLYGVLAQLVAQRTQEIGVRMALGARTTDVLRAMVTEGMLLVMAGVGLGLFATWFLTRSLAALLYGVKPADPLTLIGVCSVLILAALCATYIPARRAARVDPMAALRCE
jgi:predicted permease